jgi:hypothetical protein
LRGVNWGQNIEDEQSVINQIIESQLKPADWFNRE